MENEVELPAIEKQLKLMENGDKSMLRQLNVNSRGLRKQIPNIFVSLYFQLQSILTNSLQSRLPRINPPYSIG